MQNKFKLYTPSIIALMIIAIVITVTTFFFNRWLFVLCCIILAVGLGVVFVMLNYANRKIGKTIETLGNDIYYANNKAFIDSNLPVIAVYDNYEIVWYNDVFLQNVLDDRGVMGDHILKVFSDIPASEGGLIPYTGFDIEYNDKKYTVFASDGGSDHSHLSVLYFIENTQLKDDAKELADSRLSVAIVSVDNYSELSDSFDDLARAKIFGEIELEVKSYFTERNSYMIRSNRDRFLIFAEQRGVEKMKEDRFDILNEIRGIKFENNFTTTISIGIGHDDENNYLHESENLAKQALDMCLGRGGDQAALKTETGYDFYGGVSSGVEKRTKVKSRIIASAISELVESSSNVIIMGHRFADLDALGSAVGMLKAVKSINPSAFICMDTQRTLVESMLKKLMENGYSDKDFRHPDDAKKAINNNTMVIIVDAHVSEVLESEEIYRAAKSVVVIDHHRKLVDFIDDAVIFYHEPYASSASEMVAELVQYFPSKPEITNIEADAMLAGITLDTKNFVMRTGVRTFEAAAWLRRMGADTVEVKRMFASSMESYQNKSRIVSKTSIYKGCAIAYSKDEFGGIRVASAQAADDLMNINGIIASFVAFPFGDVANVSARSMGDMNVQVVMESLGGGGHQTMAAAQFQKTSVEEAIKKVKVAIDKYYDSLSEYQLEDLKLSTELLDVISEEEYSDIDAVEGQELSKVRPIDD